MRLARFAKANEVGDWFNPQHTFIFTNAVHQAVKRTTAPDVVRAIFHGALSVYMDRFLNVPPAKLPSESGSLEHLPNDAKALRDLLSAQLNEQSRIDDTARTVSRYVTLKHPIAPLFDTLAYVTVREDLDFHTLQVLEAGYQQYHEWEGQPEAEHILVGVIRDLAAFCPTPRARLRTAVTALRLHHGDHIFEEYAVVYRARFYQRGRASSPPALPVNSWLMQNPFKGVLLALKLPTELHSLHIMGTVSFTSLGGIWGRTC